MRDRDTAPPPMWLGPAPRRDRLRRQDVRSTLSNPGEGPAEQPDQAAGQDQPGRVARGPEQHQPAGEGQGHRQRVHQGRPPELPGHHGVDPIEEGPRRRRAAEAGHQRPAGRHAVAGLAYANGANDNFKGVATLFGSGTTDYRRALAWATFTTLLGSLTAVLLAGELLKSFSGRGLVPDALVNDPRYVAAVALGAGLTVLLATRIGMPVSTTHGLVGGLVGAGWAAGAPVHLPKLASAFFAPLLLSPVLAITATVLL